MTPQFRTPARPCRNGPTAAEDPAGVRLTRPHVEAAIVLAPQISEYLEDVDDVLRVVQDAVRRWHRYRERGHDEIDPDGTALSLRQYVDRYADRVESEGVPEPGKRFDYDLFLRHVWHQHVQRLQE